MRGKGYECRRQAELKRAGLHREEPMPRERALSTKTSLIPVILSPEQFEAVATVARLKGSTMGEFIAKTSITAALRDLQTPQSDSGNRQRRRCAKPLRRPLSPEP